MAGSKIFVLWGKGYGPKKHRPFTIEPRKHGSVLAGIPARSKQIAFEKAAILRELHRRLLRPRKPKTKGVVIKDFLRELNSGILSPPGTVRAIKHVGRSSLYGWPEAYQKDGLMGLAPKYKTKTSKKERAIFRPLAKPIEMKFPGPPRRNGKVFFLERLKRRWKGPALECPIQISIFYSMPIPRPIKMSMRMRLLKDQPPHTLKPTLNALDCFIMNSLQGIIFKDPSQIVQFHSEKFWAWWPQTRILIEPPKV
jgi:hypothetical protein